jgi:ABC-type multidrug transport system fused ATPase/permease subunit
MIQQRRAPRFSDKAVWRYLLRYSYRKRPLFLIVAVAVFQPLILVPVAFLVKRIFDTLPQTRQTALFILYGTAMILLNVLSFAALHWIRRAALSVTKPINTELRGELLARLYTLPRSFHDKSSHGNLHSLIVIDTERVDAMSNAVVAQMLPAAVGGLALGTTLSYLSWRLLVIVIASAPIVLVFHRLALGRLRARFKTFRQSFEHFSTDVLFAIRAVDLTRLHSAEKQELERQKQGLEELRLAGEAQAMADTTYSLGQSWLLTANVAVILVAGGVMVGHRALSLGNLLAFYVTSGLLLNSLKPALFAVPQITAGFESLQRVEELLGRTEIEPYQGTTRLEMLGEVQFEAVEFSFGKTPLLERVDFTVRPHAIVAIAGPNGSGKTTLMHLICGLYRPVRGRIFMDGRDYETLSMQFLRQQIGVVPQDPLLFRGTIAENIGYGSGTLSRSEILDAAHLAALDGFIRKMPLGLDSPIGEDGIMLSGGQRQRIGLARALVRRPRLLILDEPTNHLDGAAVLELLANIRELSPRPTVLMISHDPRALNWAEQVITIPNVVLTSEVPTSAVVGCSI